MDVKVVNKNFKKDWIIFISSIAGTVISSFFAGYYFHAAKDEWKK